MHPRLIAQRQAQAHQRVVEAIGPIASTLNIDAPDLTAIREKNPQVQRVKEWESLADWFEALQRRLEEKSVQGADAEPEPQPDLRAAILAASDEELLALPGVGTKLAADLRAWAAQQSGTPED